MVFLGYLGKNIWNTEGMEFMQPQSSYPEPAFKKYKLVIVIKTAS